MRINESGADYLPENEYPPTNFKPGDYTSKVGGYEAVYKKGYNFTGWTTTNEGAPYTGGNVTGDTLYWTDERNAYIEANWENRIYEIEYNANLPENASTRDLLMWRSPSDGNVYYDTPDNKTVTFDTILGPTAGQVATFSTPILPGYTFDGWYIYPEGNTAGIRVDVGSMIWKYAEDNKFTDNKGQDAKAIVSIYRMVKLLTKLKLKLVQNYFIKS